MFIEPLNWELPTFTEEMIEDTNDIPDILKEMSVILKEADEDEPEGEDDTADSEPEADDDTASEDDMEDDATDGEDNMEGDDTADSETDSGNEESSEDEKLKSIENKKLADVYRNIHRQTKIIDKQLETASYLYNLFKGETKWKERNFLNEIMDDLSMLRDKIKILTDKDFVIDNYQTLLTLYIYCDTAIKFTTKHLEAFSSSFVSKDTD